MLWRHPGCDKSLVDSNLGADCSLLWSPENVNVCIPELEELPVLELALELEELDGRSSDHGTATCLLAELLLEGFELLLNPEDELDDGLELVPELVPEEDVSDVPPLAPPVTEMIANSTRPEAGLIRTSLMVPRFSPEEELTVALVNSLALTACWLILPVALKLPDLELPREPEEPELLLPRLLPEEEELPSELPGLLWDELEPEEPRLLSDEPPDELELPDEPLELLLPDELCACAAVTKQAAHNATAAINCFLINLPFVCCCVCSPRKSDTTGRRF